MCTSYTERVETMKQTVRKSAAFALAAVMAAGASGCVSKKESGMYEIKYYAYSTPFKDDAMVLEKINEYLEEKIGARVNWINIQPSEYNEKMRMLFSSNEEFDVCFTASYADFYNNVENDVFLPMDELLQNEGKEIYDLTPEYFFDAATVDGKIYALPAIKDVAEEWVFSCKTWLLDKYNLKTDNIRTLADLEPLLQTIKDNEPDIYPVLIRGNNNFFRFLPFEDISGCSVGAFKTDNYDKIVNQYDTEEAREYFKLMRSWYQKGFMRSDAATATNDSDIRAAGNWFAAYGGYLPYSEIQPNVDEKEKTTIIHNMNEPHVRTGNVLGSALAISSNSKNPQKAMEFINLINTDPYLRNLAAFGIEGVHYEKVGDKHYKLPAGAETRNDTGYAPMEYPQGNRFLLMIEEGKPDDMWEKFEEFNNSAKISPALGFVFNPKNVMNEISAIENVYQEYAPSLMVGATDPDEFLPSFLEKLKVAGSEKVIAEMQSQYDEWKSQNK